MIAASAAWSWGWNRQGALDAAGMLGVTLSRRMELRIQHAWTAYCAAPARKK